MKKKIPFTVFAFNSFYFGWVHPRFIENPKIKSRFFDSSYYVPTLTIVPFGETGPSIFNVIYQNEGSSTINNLRINLMVTHVSDPAGGAGLGLLKNDTFLLASINSGEIDTFKLKDCVAFNTLGRFNTEFIIFNTTTGNVLDSNSFLFDIGDTIMGKDYSSFPLSTGPSLFTDSNLNQPGGTVVGDRFATLFEFKSSTFSSLNNAPTSISFFIANNSSNVGVEIVPKIWEVEENKLGTGMVVGNEVASSFLFLIQFFSTSLGSWLHLQLDNGVAIVNGLGKGKYAAGFEVTGMASGKTPLLGRDTIAEKLQPMNSSFVYFGQDSIWYEMDQLPGVRLNFGNTPVGGNPCNVVGIEEIENQKNIIEIYPNPTEGFFKVEMDRIINGIEIFDNRGRLIFQKENLAPSNIEKVNLSGHGKGLYLIKIMPAEGDTTFRKLIVR